MIKVIIADDHPGMREAWQFILSTQDNIEVIAVCCSGQEVIDVCQGLLPDIVLMDINMEPMSGLEATHLLLQKYPQLAVIGISIHSQPSYAQQMLKVGGRGFITKSSPSDEMIEGINEVADGNIYICREIRSGN